MRSTYSTAIVATVAHVTSPPDGLNSWLMSAMFVTGTAVFVLVFIDRLRTFRKNVADDSNEYIRRADHDEEVDRLREEQGNKYQRLEDHLTRVDTFTQSAVRELRDSQYAQQGKIDHQGKQLDSVLDKIEVMIGKNDGMIAAVAKLEATVAIHYGNRK